MTTATTRKTTRTTKADKAKPKASAVQKEQARKARTGARIAKAKTTKSTKTTAKKAAKTATKSTPTVSRQSSNLAGHGGVAFSASDFMTGDIWVPDERIPAIDEATYERYLTQAEGQARSIQVAGKNLQNMAGLHKLEGQSIDIAIAARGNDVKYLKLDGVEIDYQTQAKVNAGKEQKFIQATQAHEFSVRETGYLQSQHQLRGQNYELEINQAQHLLSEKTARFRAQLAGS